VVEDATQILDVDKTKDRAPLEVYRLGRVSYEQGLELQRRLVEERRAGHVPDTLLLLEHPHVLTLGVRRDGGRSNIVATPERLQELGVGIFETGRGGDITYHGPGQLVGYPVLDLRSHYQDVHRYVRDLEEVLIRTCADYGVTAERLPGFTGAWVRHPERGLEKVAAIGVRIARWITSHGFALNVNTNLEFFRLIVPCGIADRGVTSLQALAGAPVDMRAVEDALVAHFARVFQRAVSGAAPSPASPGRAR
jgi:lipoyl(octanoyl) transferase